jgi:hypothetical protein
MRQPIRPFVTAYKNRPKSTMRSAPKEGGYCAPDLFELGGASHQDEAYQAALRAADAVFGRTAVRHELLPPMASRSPAPATGAHQPQAEVQQPAPSPQHPPASGRVLPNLLEQDSELAIRLDEAEHKRPRKKREAAQDGEEARAVRSRAQSKTRRSAPQEAQADAAIELAPEHSENDADGVSNVAHPKVAWLSEPAADEQALDGPIRGERAIQSRWVHKTELKPGEKWKRRLRGAAR